MNSKPRLAKVAPVDDIEWSGWVPFAEAVAQAPRTPGVYMAREGESGAVIYIGMAGERRGSGTPRGIQGRLSVYATGKGIAGGLGEAVFDRALADPKWLRARLHELETVGPRRAKHWGVEAFRRADLQVRWTKTADRASAAALEDRLVREAGGTLWNKASVKAAEYAAFIATVTDHQTGLPGGGNGSATGGVTQPITAVDLRKNQIRVPTRFRALLPADKVTGLTVVVRGEPFICSWDPRTGPDRVRSGLLRFPSQVLPTRVVVGERLVVSTTPDTVELS